MGLLLKENIKIQRIESINQFGDTIYAEPFVVNSVEIERYPIFYTIDNKRVVSQGAKITIFSSDNYTEESLLHARVIDDNYRIYYITNIKSLKNSQKSIIKTEIILEEKGGDNDN
ncbi:hypothetical protein L8T26_05095 [Lactococcus petauri]|uniref:hypothetical protein n=1 Tax=Lactococcus petauri TaxID=1940789 RepID=UPI001EE154D5|nr:hypothetical protein [Lactococcus petauri]MCG3096712.1 hypothetical protein [Lactococcus petauri]